MRRASTIRIGRGGRRVSRGDGRTRSFRAARPWLAAVLTVLVPGIAGAAYALPITTSAPANLPPTPAFTAAWNNAQSAFAHCEYPLAYKRYRAAKPHGVRLADPNLRFRFETGLAIATYAVGYKRTAVSYVRTASAVYSQDMTTDQRRLVQVEATELIDVLSDAYVVIKGGSFCRAGENSPF
jgi:hypothetical protein